ncbi:MAG: magnesium/cobalt transporter CorA [Promethearchaeota archaeon]
MSKLKKLDFIKASDFIKMPKFIKRSKKVGLPPGTPVFVGEPKTDKVTTTVLDYDENQIEQTSVSTIKEFHSFLNKPTVTWINVDGLHDIKLLEEYGKEFQLHPLTLEDIIHTDQRPKVEEYANYLFIILKMLDYEVEREEIIIEQVSLILSENIVLSFQERTGDVFNLVRDRIIHKKGTIRRKKADYLVHALIDVIVDHYFIILEKLQEKIEILEEELVINPMPQTLRKIHSLRTNMIFVRKAIWPLREVVSLLQRSGSRFIQEDTQKYIRDVYDHTIQVIETVETLRDVVSGMLDIYLSSVSNKMNEVMKVLTIIATIAIPLTVISGIYGMNFEVMPELKWVFGYPFTLILMGLVVITMLVYFWRKKWL